MEITEKGICRLSIVPVRAQANEKSEMVTQLLFGDHYTVLEGSSNEKWHRIKIEFDGYEGWIDKLQHKEISNEHFDHLNQTEFKISTDISSTILYKKRLIQIVSGSILPISSNELFEVNEQFAFNGTSKNLGEKHGFEFLKQTAKNFKNAPYLWGGKTPFGTDCSGLTQQLFRICGYTLKRDAKDQFLQGAKIESITEAQPGDLGFFANDNGEIIHVGVLLEDQNFIHASGFVRIDKLDENGIFNEDLSSYSHKLTGIRRILKT